MQINVSNTSTGSLGEINQIVLINGIRRSDIYCASCSESTGDNLGRAELIIKDGGYDAKILLENDLVEIKIYPYGILFRGFVTARNTDVNGNVVYTAIDIVSKLQDTFFREDYAVEDEVTKTVLYDATIKQIGQRAEALYTRWATEISYPVKIVFDLATFPDVKTGPQSLKNINLLDGLNSVLQSIDYRYRVGIRHEASRSVVFVFVLGDGPQRNLIRATDPSASPSNQPAGSATVGSVDKSENSINTVSHVLAQGEARQVETALELTGDWLQVADDFTVPDGDLLLNYVTDTEAFLVINNYEKYTTEQIDFRNSDEDFVIENPYYRKKYVDVGRRYLIPTYNDTFYYLNNEELGLDELSQPTRQVPIGDRLVQTYDGKELKPFIVFKRLDEETYYIKLDGFSIEDNKHVVFDKPFVDTYSHALLQGNYSEYYPNSYDETAKTSQQIIVSAGVDLTTVLTSAVISAGVWLYLGELNSYYKIISTTSNTLTVAGNLTDAGGSNTGSQWMILIKSPFVSAGTDGAGSADGSYKIASPDSTTLVNNLAGMFLVLANYDAGVDGFLDAPADLKVYKISYNTTSHLFLDDADTDLSDASSNYVIIDPRYESFRFYDEIYLNCVFPSLQQLEYYSGDISYLKSKRKIVKTNDQYKWQTQYNNFQIVKSEVTGSEDKYSIVKNTNVIDTVKKLTELTTWAGQTLQGKNLYEINYSITLPFMDVGLHIGDRLIDNRVDSTCTLTAVDYDFVNFETNIMAVSV